VRNGIRILVGHELFANLEVLMAKRILKSRVRGIAEGHISLKFPETGIDHLTLARARRLLPTADGIVAVSKGIRRELIEYSRVPPSKVTTFYNVFRPAEIRRLAEAPAPETAGLAPFIVGCGRFVEAKGFADLIRAVAQVRARRPIRLVLLGDGPLRAALARCASEADLDRDVLLPGFEPNPFRYFARAAAFCLSSRWGEACPRVIVEAMACGTPVIASDCHFGPEELLDGAGTESSTKRATSSSSSPPSAACSTIARNRRVSSPPDCSARRTSRNRRSCLALKRTIATAAPSPETI